MNEPIKKVSILGAGIMGAQIAARTLLYNYLLDIYDINSEALDNAKKFIKGYLNRKKSENLLEKITFHSDLFEAVKDTDLIIEAIPENLELKKKFFSEIDKLAPPHTIIATNSSTFPVSRIEDAVERKDKVLNIHFYPPITARPMADIMRGSKTSDDTFEKGKKWITSIECRPLIVKKESFGFLFNRLWRAVKKEALEIWAQGYADIEDIDAAWRIFTGMPTGLFLMFDGVGLDTIYNVELSYYNESGDPRDKPPEALKEIVERGDLGVKTGKGFYVYKKK
jgi:3-hydroxybutyryl-CoA dehydrogenase